MKTDKTAALVAKLRGMADGMQKTIDAKIATMTQAWTPKRGREYQVRYHEGNNLRSAQSALRALADAHERGDCPAVLSSIKTKAEVVDLTRTRSGSNGYYDHRDTGVLSVDNEKSRGLRALLESAKTKDDEARDAAAKQRSILEGKIAALRFMNVDGFFPTPSELAKRMLDYCCIDDDARVLEPSAGIGSLADAVREVNPRCTITTCEIRPALLEILRMKGYDAVEGDFLEQFHGQEFDVIIMNPPFERKQDVRHIEHAMSLLAPGGALVGLCATRDDDLLNHEWVEHSEVVYKAFAGADAFRRTGVNCQIVVMRRPGVVSSRSEQEAAA